MQWKPRNLLKKANQYKCNDIGVKYLLVIHQWRKEKLYAGWPASDCWPVQMVKAMKERNIYYKEETVCNCGES